MIDWLPRLAHAHADARQQQLREVLRHAAQCGHHAPHRQAGGDDVAPAGPVCQPRDRDAQRGVEDREHQPRQQPQLRIAQRQVALDRLQQDRQDLPVHEAEEIGQRQQCQRDPAALEDQGLVDFPPVRDRGHPPLLIFVFCRMRLAVATRRGDRMRHGKHFITIMYRRDRRRHHTDAAARPGPVRTARAASRHRCAARPGSSRRSAGRRDIADPGTRRCWRLPGTAN